MSNETTVDAGKLAERIFNEAVADFLRALMLMLGMGAVHSQVAAVPHPGYWTAFLSLWGVQAIASAVRKVEVKA